MTLTKAQIAEMLAEQNGFAKNKSIELVENLLSIIKQTLQSGQDFLVSGFGKFCVKDKGKRRGRNPATGSDLMLFARKAQMMGKVEYQLLPSTSDNIDSVNF